MNHNTKIAVKQSGFKIQFLAEKIGVNRSQLSMALNDYRPLPAGKEEELKRFLNKNLK